MFLSPDGAHPSPSRIFSWQNTMTPTFTMASRKIKNPFSQLTLGTVDTKKRAWQRYAVRIGGSLNGIPNAWCIPLPSFAVMLLVNCTLFRSTPLQRGVYAQQNNNRLIVGQSQDTRSRTHQSAMTIVPVCMWFLVPNRRWNRLQFLLSQFVVIHDPFWN